MEYIIFHMDNRNDVTRISDLPQNNTNTRQSSQFEMPNQTQYKPLNVHQNPFGIPEPQDRQLPAISGGMGGFSGMGMPAPPPDQVNRGVDNDAYMHDEQVMPNYVPTQKLTTDYLREYEDKVAKKTEEYARAKHQESMITSLYDEIQIPILIGVLFFVFQMPFLNAMMFKYLSFMQLYHEDGNLNLFGITFKSILFGLCYFGFIRLSNYLA